MPSAGPTRLSLAGREHYCNQFAGAVLVPGDALAAMPEARALGEAATTPSDRDIAPVAAMFRVSKQVLWYRLRDTDLITTQRFAAKWAAWAHQSPPPKSKGGSRQPPGKRVLNQKGLSFTGLVLDARGERLITTNEALDYLAIPSMTSTMSRPRRGGAPLAEDAAASLPALYLIDTSAVIDLRRDYPLRTFARLWQWFADLTADGRLIAPEEVRLEISLRDDELKRWTAARRPTTVAVSSSRRRSRSSQTARGASPTQLVRQGMRAIAGRATTAQLAKHQLRCSATMARSRARQESDVRMPHLSASRSMVRRTGS